MIDAVAMEPVAAGHAFISYAHEDMDQVDGLCNFLSSQGIAIWRDRDRLWPGDDWQAQISRAIKNHALAFVACFSDKSVAKTRGWQNEEIRLAVTEYRQRQPDRPWIFPVRFSQVELPEFDLDATRALRSLHCADLFGLERDLQLARLAQAIARVTDPALIPSGQPDPVRAELVRRAGQIARSIADRSGARYGVAHRGWCRIKE
jgi:TIR domain-containing protein